jgi:hypothetical protein
LFVCPPQITSINKKAAANTANIQCKEGTRHHEGAKGIGAGWAPWGQPWFLHIIACIKLGAVLQGYVVLFNGSFQPSAAVIAANGLNRRVVI